MALADAVEAAQARDLLDEILLDADIEAMRGLMHPPARCRRLDTIADRRQHRVHLTVRDAHAEQTCQAGAPQVHPTRRLGSAAGSSAGHLHRPRLAPDY